MTALTGFAIVEQMGHRRVVGAVDEVDVCGQRFVRVTTLSTPPIVTLVHPQSLYAVTPCTEAHAQRAGGRDYSPLRELEAPDRGAYEALGDDEADVEHAQLERDHARLKTAADALWAYYLPGYDGLEAPLRALVDELSAALCEGGGEAPAVLVVDEEPVPPDGPCAHCAQWCGRLDYCFGCRAHICDAHSGPIALMDPHGPEDHLAPRGGGEP